MGVRLIGRVAVRARRLTGAAVLDLHPHCRDILEPTRAIQHEFVIEYGVALRR